MGAVIGPLLALLLLALTNDDVRTVAKWALIPAVLSAVLTFFVKEVRSQKVEKSFEKVPLSPKLKKTIALLVAIQLTNIPDALLPLRLHDMGFSTKGVVFGYALYMFVATLAAYPAGTLVDRLHPKQVYLIGLTFFAISYIS